MNRQEMVLFGMRELFEQHGYRRFEMSKFEEYDFYAENRNFLSSENILTFTGLDGKLLALKPDVTLSIVKNTRGNRKFSDRVYYHENVYRARKGDKEYREIMQAGVELIGSISAYEILEVLLLARQCLKLIDDSCLLDLSHMGFVTGLLEVTGLSEGNEKKILKAVREKNIHEIHEICAAEGVEADMENRLRMLASVYGGLRETLDTVRPLCCNRRMEQAYEELASLADCLERLGCIEGVNLDFSIVGGMDYYNGIMFQGFIQGIPEGILSGGRYDNLAHKFGKETSAIGFAVYLDFLERFQLEKREFDTDVLLLRGENTDPAAVARRVQELNLGGESVTVCLEDTGEIRCRRTIDMKGVCREETGGAAQTGAGDFLAEGGRKDG